METITNAVNTVTTTASKAIWGDQATNKDNVTEGKEPISGETGNVKAGEPYDKGNDDNATTAVDSTKLPSTAAHTDSTAAASTSVIPATTNIEPLHKDSKIEGVTAPVDDKTKAATQAAIVSLEDDTKNLSVGDKSTTGDGLVSAKKVAEGEGAHTGVKSDLSAPTASEPIGTKDTTEKSLGTSSTTTPALAGTSKKVTDERKSTSSSSSNETDAVTGQKKKKVSLKDKIKAKLHHHKDKN